MPSYIFVLSEMFLSKNYNYETYYFSFSRPNDDIFL